MLRSACANTLPPRPPSPPSGPPKGTISRAETKRAVAAIAGDRFDTGFVNELHWFSVVDQSARRPPRSVPASARQVLGRARAVCMAADRANGTARPHHAPEALALLGAGKQKAPHAMRGLRAAKAVIRPPERR
jgi:hypothetical protein